LGAALNASTCKKGLCKTKIQAVSKPSALLEWVGSAKTEPTRAKRVEEIASKAAQNIRANQWQPKEKK
jgi:uncharacterized protein YdeI (YjbR/CyaY-like superfamily)